MDQELYDLHIAAGRAAGKDRTCGEKVAYPSEESGQRAAEAMNAKESTRKPLEAYPCAFCAGWHLGRKMSLDELRSHQAPPPPPPPEALAAEVHARRPGGASLTRLVDIMDRLLAPDGCPWDREQTLESLRPFLVEETYEVIDALARGDVPAHCDELGDLMMQIVFHAAIRRAEGQFDIDDVIASISDKLVRRHPHVFAAAKGVDTAEKVLAQWDEIKATEKPKGKRTLDGIPHGPALQRAQKIGQRCGKVGFDWPGWEGSFAKVEEEVAEINEAIRSQDPKQGHAELGDLLLACVNLARKLGVDAENALVDATRRFQQRFELVEDRLAERGKTPQQSSLEEMDALWTDAKNTLRT